MSLPKTLQDVVTAVAPSDFDVAASVYGTSAHQPSEATVRAVLLAAGIKLDTDGVTLIYPSVQGTSTPRYQPEQRNVRFRGGRK